MGQGWGQWTESQPHQLPVGLLLAWGVKSGVDEQGGWPDVEHRNRRDWLNHCSSNVTSASWAGWGQLARDQMDQKKLSSPQPCTKKPCILCSSVPDSASCSPVFGDQKAGAFPPSSFAESPLHNTAAQQDTSPETQATSSTWGRRLLFPLEA